MKNIFFLFIATVFLFINSSCTNAKKDINKEPKDMSNSIEKNIENNPINTMNNADNKVINMLKEFYTAYAVIWSGEPPTHFDTLKHQCDSLVAIYCTNKLRQEAHEALTDDIGTDLLTDDWGIDVKSLKNLEIDKDSIITDMYIVSYTTDCFPVSPMIPVKYRIVLKVNVIKEGKSYKINEVKGEGVACPRCDEAIK